MVRADERPSTGVRLPCRGGVATVRLLGDARGVVLGLEDLQSADPESAALVEYLAENVGPERLLLVGTVRDDEPSAPLASLRELAVRGRCGGSSLDGLPRRTSSGSPRLGSGARCRIRFLSSCRRERRGCRCSSRSCSGGLIAAGALRRQARSGRRTSGSVVQLPSSFVAASKRGWRRWRTRRRRAGCGGGAGTQLRHGSAFGLHRAIRKQVVGGSTRVRRARLVEAGHELEMDRMQFRHALVRDAVLERTPPPERRALAGAALAAVEAAHPGVPGGWCGLAVELAQLGGQDDRAVALLRVASERRVARRFRRGRRGSGARGYARGHRLTSTVVQLELLETLVAAGRFERAWELGERLSFALAR